ncbi:MAG TPA: UDP-N-acetylmuramoyl-tripeptide--D-alanyl-D-alanine ligase [Ideonella sp.]|uniref:UDP-N-acetylmuramoyl-tripeptide--D-alanyl-D- alanine ligase n=1 Tax=Ideonella sp. TaxID=1929293 RepID=UPI002CD8C5E2|nr:UDP-N-acetylmuramoyl-tripeptide--D-alanyl-D-alanine ligase [Ideonella sp.]HSI51087.1 UDP-N-acetylmuramoyl-tripeptide--D-alanyl-D-alanine ligase [Ideonella sp.]
MASFTLATVHRLLPDAQRVGPAVAGGDEGLALRRVHTDTRTLAAGDLFVALKGERFDAHDFLPQAAAAGAVAAIASHGLAEAGLPGLQVADPLRALQQLATGWREQFTLPLIAITGSNGKTTVTQMIASILRAAQGEAALATAGNLNNHIGVPLTVLRLTAAHRLAVIELGMNHPGEIAELAAIAQPTVALVNNAQREHLEFMQTVEAVAQENGSVISALPDNGVAVFPADDAHSATWQALAGTRRVLRFALGDTAETGADVGGQARWAGDHWVLQMHTPVGEAGLALRVAGRHNVKNALAATACALAAGVPLGAVVAGLQAFEPVKGRSQVKLLASGQTLIDDSYNANPDSVRAAIEVLAELPAPRWLVLGDMGEVGNEGPAFHAEIGALAAERGIEHVWTAGELALHAAQAYGPTARHFTGVAELLAAVDRPKAQAVVVKGSRFMKMEQVVAALQAAGAQDKGEAACC